MRKSQAVAGVAGAGIVAAGGVAVTARADRPVRAALIAAAAGVAAWAAFAPRNPLFGRVAWRGSVTGERMAITFDDGPSESTPAILDALGDAGARATFFVLGRQARRFPDVIARMAREGHQIANHGDDHGILIFRGPGHVRRQLRLCERAVEDAAGPGAMSGLFRAPHGFRGPATWPAARAAGYRMAGWTTGVFDSAEPGVDVIVARCNPAMRPGSVLLLHDADGWAPERSRPQTAAALPGILALGRERGLEMVTMDELLGTAL